MVKINYLQKCNRSACDIEHLSSPARPSEKHIGKWCAGSANTNIVGGTLLNVKNLTLFDSMVVWFPLMLIITFESQSISLSKQSKAISDKFKSLSVVIISSTTIISLNMNRKKLALKHKIISAPLVQRTDAHGHLYRACHVYLYQICVL